MSHGSKVTVPEISISDPNAYYEQKIKYVAWMLFGAPIKSSVLSSFKVAFLPSEYIRITLLRPRCLAKNVI